MKKINFTKMVASGNDFIVIPGSGASSTVYRALAKKACNRKFGIGADGLLVLEKTRKAAIKMRIFNADGSEAEMCGNGARCAALYACSNITLSKSHWLKIETKAGILEANVEGQDVKIKLTEPKNIKLDIPVLVNGRSLRVNFIDTGVPHAVIFTQGLEKIKITDLGRTIRYHQKFSPRGTNVDFVEVLDNNSLKIRTYERGVEDETLACGTGSVASALIFALKGAQGNKINLHTQSGEVLKIYFNKEKNSFHDVWLEGKAKIVYKGAYHV
ncbi:MAG: diaminopimelate epimerase [Candidatus Omnitrophica bacterium]|nr:diaminopimelate epimerase [Candidatus Omnitrophota bacterium]